MNKFHFYLDKVSKNKKYGIFNERIFSMDVVKKAVMQKIIYITANRKFLEDNELVDKEILNLIPNDPDFKKSLDPVMKKTDTKSVLGSNALELEKIFNSLLDDNKLQSLDLQELVNKVNKKINEQKTSTDNNQKFKKHDKMDNLPLQAPAK